MRWLALLLAGLAALPGLAAPSPQTGNGARIPAPSAETLELERKKLLERLGAAGGDVLSKSVAAKLAARTFEEAKSATAGSDAQFAALDAACRFAVEGADIELALNSLELLEAVFEVDARAQRIAALKSVARNVSGKQTRAITVRALEFARKLVDLEDFEGALEILDDVKLRKFARDDAELAKLHEALWTADVQAFKTMREWLAKLETAPDDPDANHYAGYYYCFERNDFARGLPLLARSPMAPFKELATLDNAAPTQARERLLLAQRWAAFANDQLSKARPKAAARLRARKWIDLARADAALDEPTRAALDALAAELERAQQSEADRAAARQADADEKAGKSSAPETTAQADARATVDGALEWLAQHQKRSGSWGCADFRSECIAVLDDDLEACTDVGHDGYDVGVTALALLAYLEAGCGLEHPEYGKRVEKALEWLFSQQDAVSGAFGQRFDSAFNYMHAMATLALARAQAANPDPNLLARCQKAVDFIEAARVPGPGWRYNDASEGSSHNDTSITGWMLRALLAARAVGVEVDDEALAGGLRWIEMATDPATGRVGYDTPGSFSSRAKGFNDRFNPERGESMTAIGLHSRLALGQSADTSATIQLHAELLQRKLPRPGGDPGALEGVDFYYWYHGSLALKALGGPARDAWFERLRPLLAATQRQDGHFKGSWDAVNDPWGYVGGRVYSTALGALALLAELDAAPPAAPSAK
jgi:uncharacterized protein (DUF305 family)